VIGFDVCGRYPVSSAWSGPCVDSGVGPRRHCIYHVYHHTVYFSVDLYGLHHFPSSFFLTLDRLFYHRCTGSRAKVSGVYIRLGWTQGESRDDDALETATFVVPVPSLQTVIWNVVVFRPFDGKSAYTVSTRFEYL
jgi:hypothetical protein